MKRANPSQSARHKEFAQHVAKHCAINTFEHALLGLCAESGEVADVYKKSLYKKQPLDLAKFKDELGDVLWYLELNCQLAGTTLEEIQALNIAKLTKRNGKK